MRCGVGDYTRSLVDAIANDPEVLIGVLTSREAQVDPPSVELLSVESWDLSRARSVVRQIQGWKPDLVHVQYPTQGYRGVFPWILPSVLRLVTIPTVLTWHEIYRYPHPAHLPNLLAPAGIVVVRPNYVESMFTPYKWILGSIPIRFIPNASSLPVVILDDLERNSVRAGLNVQGRRVITFFGFFYPSKGVDRLFEIADPQTDHLVLMGPLDSKDSFQSAIRTRAESEPWRGRVTVTGFEKPDRAARILAASDAVVLPFRDGGGIWNTSLHAASQQGTLVVTTSRDRTGYDAERHVYWAEPLDMEAMRRALDIYSGVRRQIQEVDPWKPIAEEHIRFYREILDQ